MEVLLIDVVGMLQHKCIEDMWQEVMDKLLDILTGLWKNVDDNLLNKPYRSLWIDVMGKLLYRSHC